MSDINRCHANRRDLVRLRVAAACRLLLLGCACALAVRCAAQEIANDHTRVRAIRQDDVCVGFDLAAQSRDGWKPVAEVRWSSGGRWTCTGVRADGKALHFTGFDTPGTGTPELGPDTTVTVALTAGDPWPEVSFRLVMKRFDEERWRSAWRNLSPVYFLRCSLPADADQGQMFYQHSILYPGPSIDPYPITMGPMRGDWCDNWSYAPAMGAAPVPAVGLWSPQSRLFVAYEFGETLFSDRSAKYVASSYCAGLEDHPGQFFCLSWPYAEDWMRLRLPEGPVTVATTFRILYHTDLPSHDDPNRFVLRSLTSRYRDSLPPAPRMNDMAWLKQGLEASQTRFLHDLGLAKTYPTQGVAPILLVPYERCEKAFFDPGAVQLIAHQTGKACRYAFSVGDSAGLAELKRQIEMLMPEAVEERYGDDVCYVWKHPLHGQFKAGLGGANATGTRHMFNWGIASAMLWFYRSERDQRYLKYIDGMVKWTRHCLYDRAGMADLPWAVFSMGAANGGEFLLDYYYTFRDDPERGQLAEEAWRLAEMIVYRNSYPYLGDPMDGDSLDPSFLLQAVNSAYWIGAVTWGEMGRVPEMWIRMYLETGDPLLKYLVRGCLERYYIGTINAAGHYTENLLVFKGGGMSGGWGANNFRWLAEPLGSAILQVDVGPRAALAFCKGTRALDVDEFAYARPANYRFRVVAIGPSAEVPTDPFDIMVTSPHEGILGKAVRVNGQPLDGQRYVIGSDGVNALIRGVRVGDVVTIGDPGAGGQREPGPTEAILPERRAFHPAPTPDWLQIDLRRQAAIMRRKEAAGMRRGAAPTVAVDNRWSGPWGGLVPGPRVASRIHFTLMDPSVNEGRGAVGMAEPVSVPVAEGGPCVIILGETRAPRHVFGGTRVARCSIDYRDGTSETVVVNYEDGVEISRGMEWYDKEWWLRAFAVGKAGKSIRSLTLQGSSLLFGVVSARTPVARDAIAALRAKQASLRKLHAYRSVQLPTRHVPAVYPWTSGLPYRFIVQLDAPPRASMARIVRVRQDLRVLLRQVGIQKEPDPDSVEAYAIGAGYAKPTRIAAQFCPDSASDPSRGDLLLRLPKPRSAQTIAVYFGPARAGSKRQMPGGSVRFTREGPRAILSNGKLRMAFDLSGKGIGPRMMELGPEGGPNWLGPTGHDAGFAHLCACQDNVTWYDFGALQTDDATVEVVDSGPLATTVRFSNLRIYGAGTAVPFAGVGTAGSRAAGVKGVAEWYVRLYADDMRADNWVAYTITDPDTRWTRPMEVRYAPAEPRPGKSGGQQGEHGSWARQGELAIVALDLRPDRNEPAPYFTAEDGNLIGVHIGRATGIGRFVSDVWRIVPASLSPEAMAAEAEPIGIVQFAVEERVGGRAVRRTPGPIALEEDDADRWEQRVVGQTTALFAAGRPDDEDGLRNKDNPDEGASARKQIGNTWCLTPGLAPNGQPQQFTYFDVLPETAKRVRGKSVFVAVEYLDIGRASMELHYDSLDEAVRKSEIPGAFKDAAAPVTLTNSGRRRTAVFSLPDPRFEDNCNGADFRLSFSGGPVHVVRVALIIPFQ